MSLLEVRDSRGNLLAQGNSLEHIIQALVLTIEGLQYTVRNLQGKTQQSPLPSVHDAPLG